MYKSRLEIFYREQVVPKMQEKYGFKNLLQVPRIKKVVLNIGVSSAKEDIKFLDEAREELSLISGQAPVITKVRKSISNFKIRQGMSIGCKVTLRGAMMYDFLDRMINVALPRVRDFQGVQHGNFDEQGNYTLGLQDEFIFPEIDPNKINKRKGLSITIAVPAKKEHSLELLKLLGLPFKKQ